MTFYEQELRKIVGERYPDATYVGRACYVRLDEMNRAKIQFVTTGIANQYTCSQFLACFTVQFSRCRSPTLLQGQIEMLGLLTKHFDLILWWRLPDSNR